MARNCSSMDGIGAGVGRLLPLGSDDACLSPSSGGGEVSSLLLRKHLWHRNSVGTCSWAFWRSSSDGEGRAAGGT